MKKKMIAALVLTAILCISAVFADEISSSKKLKYLGIISGDENGQLNLENYITRAEMMKVLFKLDPDAREENYNYNNRFSDVKSEDWFAPYVEYANEKQISVGTSATDFSPNNYLSSEQAQTLLVRRLEYGTVTVSEALVIANEIGIKDGVMGNDGAPITRGNLFVMIDNVLNVKMNTSDKTLAQVSEYDALIEQYNLEYGISDNAKNQRIRKIQVLNDKKIMVNLENSNNDYTFYDFEIKSVKRETPINIANIEKVGGKQLVLELENLSAGTKYEIGLNGETFRFTAIPYADRIFTYVPFETSIIDNNTIKIMFNKPIDFTDLPEPKAFKISRGSVVSFEKYYDDEGYLYPNVLLVKTSNQVYGELYILEILGVKSIDGDEIETEENYNVFRFGGRKPDNADPEIKSIICEINKKITIEFTESSDLENETALDINNYKVINVEDEKEKEVPIKSVEFEDNEIGKKRSVILYFENNLIEEERHIVEIINVTDIDGNKISSSMPEKYNFYSAEEDLFGPRIKTVEGTDLNNVVVYFEEDIQLLNLDDYKNIIFDYDVKALSAKRDENDYSVLHIETTDQPIGKTLKIEMPNMIYDEMNNVTRKGYYDGMFMTSYSGRELRVDRFEPNYYGNKAYIDIRYTALPVLEEALNPFNYEITDLGYALYVSKVNDYEFRIIIKNQEQYKKYELEINNVHDLSNNSVGDIDKDGSFYGQSFLDE